MLLGEPGAGKTSVFRSLVDGLPLWDAPIVSDSTDRCIWIDGPDLTPATYDEVLGRHLTALPSVALDLDVPQDGILTVVIDQADESEICRNLPSYLKRSLRYKDVRRIRLLVACRTGDYPPSLTRVLQDAFGSCSLVDLAPLSRADAVALVDSAGVSGEQLVSEVVALRAGALASVPLTLELIVREYRESGRLTGGAMELFGDGVRLLAAEYDTDRFAIAAPTTTWPQRLQVAGRIAARLVLSGRRTLWRGSLLEERPLGTDLDVSTIPGGSEQTSDVEPFEVTPTVVDEVLHSGLFTASGNRRFAFRHSSIAAFLTAKHLISRSVTDAALRRLFLVGVPDQETASIPVSLRETAAWLVALAPERSQWLASADPESLTMHSGLVRSDSVKELIVSRLLERAADVELGDVRWHQTRWVLGHPGLARQLLPVLTLNPADFSDWPTWARARIALRLAEQCPSPDLAPLLLNVAADPRWPAEDRAHAARAAFACDATTTVPALRDVLATLGSQMDKDPGLSLRGTLLTLLWPNFLKTEAMLGALSETPSDNRYGAYEHFLSNVPTACPDEDVRHVVAWLLQRTTDDMATDGRERRFTEDNLVSHTVDRALSVTSAESLLPDIARILTTRFLDHMKVGFPYALDQVTPDGLEPISVRDLRRSLAVALLACGIEAGQAMRYFAWLVVREWEPHRSWSLEPEGPHGGRFMLLDASDFGWALRQGVGTSERPELSDGYAHLAEILFDQQSQEHFELAYQNKDNPAWPYLKWFYDPIDIHGDLAKAWRRSYRLASEAPWPERAKFIDEQHARLERARTHDTDSFWRLLWDLQFNPNTGKGEHRLDANVSDWPGCSLFDAGELAALHGCALDFLRRENDHADEWLGSEKRDYRAWAGLQSLLLLDCRGTLENLEVDCWSAWVGAIADPWSSPSSATWSSLLKKAVLNDAHGLSSAIRRVVKAQLEQGVQPLILERVEANWSPDIAEVLEEFLVVVSAALLPKMRIERKVDLLTMSGKAFEEDGEGRAALVRTWSGLLAALLSVDSALAQSVTDFVLEAVNESAEADDLELPVIVACILVEAGGVDAWLQFRTLIDKSVGFSRALALRCAGRSNRGYLEDGADEAGLSGLYRWLNAIFPQDEFGRPLGVHVITPEMEALDWREALPGTLSRRGTPAAVENLTVLAAEFESRLNLRAALVSARTNCLAATWTPADLDEVVAILAGASDPFDPASAEAVLVEALEAFQDMGSHGFREGIVRDMQRLMNSPRLLPIADHSLARDHLRAIAAYVYAEGGLPAQLALRLALEQARPDDQGLESLRGLLAVRDSHRT
ncbi:NACHT domain-containing protein [Actinacidiphila yeochonensis]|uniref:NACHT domain-containing protein n=1 Tax=Actinacidiphila yeochonensis TaxID=89050 RepID=UPI0012FF12F3|nr:hypothetical protein [Actinacidiphila yeochonensis]